MLDNDITQGPDEDAAAPAPLDQPDAAAPADAEPQPEEPQAEEPQADAEEPQQPEEPQPDAAEPQAEEPVAAPPRRRRAASRPAGPPAIVPAAAPSELPPVETHAALDPAAGHAELGAALPLPELDAPSPSAAPEAAPPARAPRKRASRPAGPPVAPGPSAAAPDSAVHAAEEEPAAAEASADAPVEPAPEKRRPTRRRRTSAAVEAAPAEPQGTGDDLAASLDALAQSRPRRRASRGAGAPESVDVAGALDSLAAAIAGRAETVAAPEQPDAAGPDADAEPEDWAGVEAPESAEGEAEPQADEVDADEVDAEGEESADEAAARRRRRRRGGRRRRRVSDREGGEEAEEASDETEEASDAEASEVEPEEPEGAAEGTSRRRRRRRRRGEESADDTAEDGVDIVVKVREPRRPRSASDEITSIEGSTRMEAKRQRRREGRAAGRRRAPILSEAEFLARREAVERTMVIRQRDDYTQIGVLEDGILVEHYVDRDSSASMIGNVYLGRVQNVLPSMEAAFIDIGRGRNAVLYAGEVDWDSFGVSGPDRKVEKVLKSGQPVLVQVTKDPVGAKGARLTSHISIPGRYVVYSPGGQLSGISRKLPEAERARLKGILDELVGENASVIVRTAAEGASEDELVRDVNRLKAQWEVIEKKVHQGNSPQLLYSEPDLTVRIVRDLFTEDFSALLVDGNGKGEDAYDTVQAYVTHVAPHLAERLVRWNRWTQGDLFEAHRIDEQVAKALERKVHLPSGGSLIIDRTEAMTVIDVNTGRFTGTQGNLEATVTSNNLEAAEEIVRQLRLRDIGGIIVIDFIDMVLPANRELLLRRLVECLGRDRTRHQVAEVTSLGLVQMTRKKIGTGLNEAFTVPCETCHGRGYHIHEAPVSSQAPADGGERDNAGRRGRSAHTGGRQAGSPSEASS